MSNDYTAQRATEMERNREMIDAIGAKHGHVVARAVHAMIGMSWTVLHTQAILAVIIADKRIGDRVGSNLDEMMSEIDAVLLGTAVAHAHHGEGMDASLQRVAEITDLVRRMRKKAIDRTYADLLTAINRRGDKP